MAKKAKKTVRPQQQVPKLKPTPAVEANEEKEVKELVITFNKLPRAHKTNSQHVNHWYFTVRHIPAGDVLHIINPESRASHTEGPASIFNLTIDGQAKVVLRLLLKGFVDSICNTFTPAIVPWSWGTQDESLALALKSCLSAVNVRLGLCRISFGNEDHIKISKEMWDEECQRMSLLIAVICKRCGDSPVGAQNYQHCSGCKQVRYCSKDCQRADWKQHKKFCELLSISTSTTWTGTTGTEKAYDGMTYFDRVASKSSYVKNLAKKIGIKIPIPSSMKSLTFLVRRIVTTGVDTTDILLNLFGMYPTDREHIVEVYEQIRLEILLAPPKGSYYYVFAKSHNLDDTLPAWTPREASEEEEDELHNISNMKSLIKQYMLFRKRKLSTIDNEDMIKILTEVMHENDECCEDWGFYRDSYIAALNSMDLGYPENHNPCQYRDQSRTLRHWGLSCS